MLKFRPCAENCFKSILVGGLVFGSFYFLTKLPVSNSVSDVLEFPVSGIFRMCRCIRFGPLNALHAQSILDSIICIRTARAKC